MQKVILFLCFVVITTQQSLAQKSEKAVYRAYMKPIKAYSEKAIKAKDFSILENYLKANSTENSELKAGTMMARAYTLSEIHKGDSIDINNPMSSPVVKQIMDYTQQAMDSCWRCHLTYKKDRVDYLSKLSLKESELYKKEVAELKKVGYKPSAEGRSLGVVVRKEKDFWVGAEMSFLTLRSYRQTIKGVNPKTQKKEILHYDPSSSIFALPMQYSFNAQKHQGEFSASLFQFSSPLYFNFTKFGFRKNFEKSPINTNLIKSSGFYRPEIGVGIGDISLLYGYNLFFKKAFRQVEPAHSIGIRYVPIIAKKR